MLLVLCNIIQEKEDEDDDKKETCYAIDERDFIFCCNEGRLTQLVYRIPFCAIINNIIYFFFIHL